ncbi:MAG TPA: SRPBCC family protein [Candidatus Limnocylindria bacterium]
MATELLRRDFSVNAPIDEAWRLLADVSTWPEWAPHIRRLDVSPPGEIGPTSSGTLHFRPAGRSQFRVSAYAAGTSWEWIGPVLGLSIRYDHRFTSNGARTQLTWTVAEDGDRSARGRLFASFYGRLVDRAIPRLQARLESPPEGG